MKGDYEACLEALDERARLAPPKRISQTAAEKLFRLVARLDAKLRAGNTAKIIPGTVGAAFVTDALETARAG